MRTFYAFLILISSSVIFSCTPEEDITICTTGTVRFTCTSDNPYHVFVDDVFKATVKGHTFKEFELPEGEHLLRAEQASGYLFTPTKRTTSISVFGCQEKEWVFP